MIAIYLRVSTVHQDTESQRHAITKWCVERGYTDVTEYADEGISGATTVRPAFQRLLEDVRAGRVTRIVTFEMSRLSRDFLDALNLMRLFTDAGVVVEVPGEGAQPFANAMEQFVMAAKSLIASQERESIRKRIKQGLANARAKGVRLGARQGNQLRAGKLKHYDPALIAKIQRLSAKLTTREIAVEVGLSHSTVAKILRRYRSAA